MTDADHPTSQIFLRGQAANGLPSPSIVWPFRLSVTLSAPITIHSLLWRLALGAGDDGFDVRSRTAKLTGNRALRNADLGIEAVGGDIDGVGEHRPRQRDRAQCMNIACA